MNPGTPPHPQTPAIPCTAARTAVTVLALAQIENETAVAIAIGGRIAGALTQPVGGSEAHGNGSCAASEARSLQRIVEAGLAAANCEAGEIQAAVYCAAPQPALTAPAAALGPGGGSPGHMNPGSILLHPTPLRGHQARAIISALDGAQPEHMTHWPAWGALAAGTFHTAPRKNAAVILWPAPGHGALVCRGRTSQRNPLAPLWWLPAPHDPGCLLSRFAQVLGLDPDRAAYELAYLATYGQARYSRQLVELLIRLHRDGSYEFTPLALSTSASLLAEALGSLVGGLPLPGRRDAAAADVARSMAAVLRYLVAHTAVYVGRQLGARGVCLGGDVALDLAQHGLLPHDRWMSQTWVMPQRGALAIAIGGALGASSTEVTLGASQPHFAAPTQLAREARTSCVRPPRPRTSRAGGLSRAELTGESGSGLFQPEAQDSGLFQPGPAAENPAPSGPASGGPGDSRFPSSPYLGPAYSDLNLQNFLREAGIPADTLPRQRAYGRAAELLFHGNRVGWFQGREASGAGLAGDRTILRSLRSETLKNLADPRRTGKIPPPTTIITLEETSLHAFDIKPNPPFASVTETGPVLSQWHARSQGSACGPVMLLRITPRQTPALYRFLSTLAELNGTPLAEAEPLFAANTPYHTPADAYERLRAGGLDALVLGDSVLYQNHDLPEVPAAGNPKAAGRISRALGAIRHGVVAMLRRRVYLIGQRTASLLPRWRVHRQGFPAVEGSSWRVIPGAPAPSTPTAPAKGGQAASVPSARRRSPARGRLAPTARAPQPEGPGRTSGDPGG